MPLVKSKEPDQKPERKRVIRRSSNKPALPTVEDTDVAPKAAKSATPPPPKAVTAKPATKKAVKKPSNLPRVTAKELFQIKPTAKFPIEPWQQGAALGEMDMPDIGVAFPSFCWEMFVGHSVLPVSACYALAGETGTYKSHLVLEMARWVLNSGGYTILAENEAKYNKDMAEAIIGTAAEDIYIYKCLNFNQVQQSLIASLKSANAEKENPLLLQIVDSIVGNSTKSSQDKTWKAGEKERDYPANALAAANFLPDYMPQLNNRPYMGVWVTHSKEEKEDMYHPTIVTLKGGGTWKYRCRIAFILNRVSVKPECKNHVWRVRLRLSQIKDMAVRGFQLPFTLRWEHIQTVDEKTGETSAKRIVKFCWHAATLDLWKEPTKYGYADYYSDVIKDLTGFAEVKLKEGRGFIAPKIGIGKEEASRDPKVILNALYADTGVLDQLRAELGIQKGLEINPDLSFESALKQARILAARRAKQAQDTAKVTILRREELAEFD